MHTVIRLLYRLNLDTLSWTTPSPPSGLQSTPPARTAALAGEDFAASKSVFFFVYLDGFDPDCPIQSSRFCGLRWEGIRREGFVRCLGTLSGCGFFRLTDAFDRPLTSSISSGLQ